MDADRKARAENRRRTWSVSALDSKEVDHDTPEQRWRRLEQLRRAACRMGGRPYPERSTREERATWPIERI